MNKRKKILSTKRHFFSKHKHFKHLLVGLGVVVVVLIIVIIGASVYSKLKTDRQQNALAPFYNTNGLSTSGPMGQVLRSEPLGISVANGTAYRIIYRTQRFDNSVTFASGMVFIPNNFNGGNPRPVVAWAHGTVGMGDACAPSRTPNPLSAISWVSSMLGRGWIVTASDYAGLGTPGTEGYLIGGDEARDVLNSVRAAQYMPGADASSTFAVWGHSQGGNSALFTASLANSYAPELNLVGTVASAPAAELVPLLNESYGGSLDWVIGPEVMVAWSNAFPGLSVSSITTAAGYNNYQKIAQQCIATSALGGIIRTKLSQQFFNGNPTDSASWRSVAQSQSAPILPPNQPVMVAESLTDQVVQPNTTALYIQQACAAGSNVTSLWLTNVGHIALSTTISPQVINWIGDRFAHVPATSTCNQPPAITPATVPLPGT